MTAELKRSISLPLITLYGLGTIIGAGIFVLIGKVAGEAGLYAPAAFLVASVVAGFTAFSYAELSSRFPKSAGEAVYLEEAFHLRWFSKGTGLFIAVIGIISSATIVNGAIGYLQIFIALPDPIMIILLVFALAMLAAWGITESVAVAATTTLISIIGLLAVVIFNAENLITLPERLPELIPPPEIGVWSAIVMGAFLAFYAFLGFEDMINVAEEVNNPHRNMPLSIILTLIISTLLYLLIATTAVLTLPAEQLAASHAPLVDLIGSDSRGYLVIAVISATAVIDGALIQMIKSSRILYGMSRQQMLPAIFGEVHPVRRTPLTATATVAVIVMIAALALPLITLAKITSFITLTLFAVVNLALWRIKLNHHEAHAGIDIPVWIPVSGFLLCTLFVSVQFFALFRHP
ncbi:MAG: APC family permease [Mariprofundaceae bacterium]|nr:APC family permease [Mariprofundaceae bacterium]